MDKIRELLSQIGASEELVNQICEAIEGWKEAQTTQLDEEFQARLVKAKELCLEEVATEKRDIARRVEIFLESQIASIERSASERMAIEESKAANTLKRTKAMLEGIEIDSSESDLQAVSEENSDLKRSIVKVGQDRDQFKVKFERADKIAKHALSRNKSLEEKVASSTKDEPVTESNRKGTKLDGGRKSAAKSKTTRRTLTESQQAGRQTIPSQEQPEDEISSIAQSIDVTP